LTEINRFAPSWYGDARSLHETVRAARPHWPGSWGEAPDQLKLNIFATVGPRAGCFDRRRETFPANG